jgi:DNA-binding GntR family transcriptional regulator
MPPVPDYADQRPAYVQIAADLRAKIDSGEYPVGSRLPANRELTEHYGVSAVTLRQALEILRAEGLTATQSTRGTFVLREAAEQPSSEYETVMKRIDELSEGLTQLREEVAAMKQPKET